jgi:hypothetical protein
MGPLASKSFSVHHSTIQSREVSIQGHTNPTAAAVTSLFCGEHDVSETGSVSVLRRGEGDTLLGPWKQLSSIQ